MSSIHQKFEQLTNARISTLEYRLWLKDQRRMVKVLADFGFNDQSRGYVVAVEGKDENEDWENIEKGKKGRLKSSLLRQLRNGSECIYKTLMKLITIMKNG